MFYHLCSPDSVSLATAHTTSPVPHIPSGTLTTTTRSLIIRKENTPRLTPSQTMSLAWLLHRCGGGGELTDPLEFCLSRFGGKERGKAALTTYKREASRAKIVFRWRWSTSGFRVPPTGPIADFHQKSVRKAGKYSHIHTTSQTFGFTFSFHHFSFLLMASHIRSGWYHHHCQDCVRTDTYGNIHVYQGSTFICISPLRD